MSSPRPVHYYHCWVGDRFHGSAWAMAAHEHFSALQQAEFDGEVFVGLVGGPEERAKAWSTITRWWPDVIPGPCADEGYEMVTLEGLHDFAGSGDPDTPVMYAHTKGSFNRAQGDYGNNQGVDKWRRAMTENVVGRWRECVEALADGKVVAGCHWLTPDSHPSNITIPMFGGNYWWAKAGYIADLPPLQFHSRYCAEGWLGKGRPADSAVLDLKPGWPKYWD